ncbi:hypothetical protein D3C71_1502800 [compost metagenome]
MVAGVQVDVLPGYPKMVGGIAPQRQFGFFHPQAHQRGRQRQDAAPRQHGRHGRQGQHRRRLVVEHLHGGKIKLGIQPLPVGLDAADGDPGAQRLAGVGLDLRTPLVHPGQHPVTHAQEPDGHHAINCQRDPKQEAEHATRVRRGSSI